MFYYTAPHKNLPGALAPENLAGGSFSPGAFYGGVAAIASAAFRRQKNSRSEPIRHPLPPATQATENCLIFSGNLGRVTIL